jgi:hypothetical protein
MIGDPITGVTHPKKNNETPSALLKRISPPLIAFKV